MASLLELPYLWGTNFRNWLFDRGLLSQELAQVPVISVGNLTSGGNGKTPFTIHLARIAQNLGAKPVVISRGYGGTVSGPHLVTEQDLAAAVGDEPLLISRRAGCPVVIARRRVEGARFVIDHNLGDLIVLDDGFQHRYLSRQLNLVLIDVTTTPRVEEFIKGKLLPAGRFREDRDRGLRRADGVVFVTRSLERSAQQDPKWLSAMETLERIIPPHLPRYRSRPNAARLVRALDGAILPVEEFHGRPVIAACGIAKPEAFYASIASLGMSVKRTIAVGDHAKLSVQHLHEIEKDEPGVPILCTEKDWVKLADARLPESLLILSIDYELEPLEAIRATLAPLICQQP